MARLLISLTLMTAFCLSQSAAAAQDNAPQPKIAPCLTDTAIAFARVRLDRLDLEPLKQFAREYAVGLGAQPPQIDMAVSVVQQVQQRFVDAGVTDLYVVAELENFMYGPYLLLELDEGADSADITKILQDVVQQIGMSAVKEYKILDGFLFAGDEEILSHIEAGHVGERPLLANALAEGEAEAVQVVICPSLDQTRAIRETVPSFPAPFETLNGDLLARGIRYVSLGVRLKPEPALRIAIQSDDEPAAQAMLLTQQAALPMIAKMISGQEGDAVADALQFRRHRDQLLVELSLRSDEWKQVASLLLQPSSNLQEKVRQNQAKNNLKQLGLAMHNWHDVHFVFPAHANYSEDGKPLLSWRVHVLPFLDQMPLYQKFHLNEPWDSEHNKQLISEMPDVFAVPGSAVAKEGKTGYVFPILPDGSAITTGTKDGIQLGEITDGVSNTALIVVADDEHSVIWTKPGDLEIDPDTPLPGLRFDREGRFQVTFADGSVRGILKSIDPEVWLAVLTRAGGEAVGELP